MTDALSRLKAALADCYSIGLELGSGGMATVDLAQDLSGVGLRLAASFSF